MLVSICLQKLRSFFDQPIPVQCKPPSPSRGVIKVHSGSTMSEVEGVNKLSCSRLKETRGIDFGKTILYINVNILRGDLASVLFPS